VEIASLRSQVNMEVKTKYDLKQFVYLVHDPDQSKRMIIEIIIVTPKLFKYMLRCGSDESEHYEHEISSTADVVTKTDN